MTQNELIRELTKVRTTPFTESEVKEMLDEYRRGMIEEIIGELPDQFSIWRIQGIDQERKRGIAEAVNQIKQLLINKRDE